MEAAFGGVPKLLSGKKFPQNVRAMRMVAEELLRETLESHDFASCNELTQFLELQALQSRTAKLWIHNFIQPVLIIMLYIRAEREADWPLHLLAVSMMVPYFFAAGHVHYARYALYYLRKMENLPTEILNDFLNGCHVMRHKPGIWNAIWSDMYIETTYMRYGHGPRGIVGLTLQPNALKKWAYSQHLSSQLLADLASMTEGEGQKVITVHKEENAARIQSDGEDRQKLRKRLEVVINPLSNQSDELLNIVTGQVAPASVNVDKALEIGKEQQQDFQATWPDGFHSALKKKVVTMMANKKSVKLGDQQVYDTSLIYSRVLGMQSVQDINLEEILAYELAPVPPSMFDNKGEMRIIKSKSTLKKKMKVEVSDRLLPPADVMVFDGCAVLWVIPWPTNGIVLDFILNIVGYMCDKLQKCHVHWVYDRYYDYSIKDHTRNARMGKEASRVYQLSFETALPPQKVLLTVSKNKVQIIELTLRYLKENPGVLPNTGTKLIINSQDPIPIQIQMGKVSERMDLTSIHEEADIVITQRVVYLANHGLENIRVICDDTDVFVLLMYFYSDQDLNCSLVMQGISADRTSIDIAACVQNQKDIVHYLPAAHSLSGCDTTSNLWGIGKAKVFNALKRGHSLTYLGHKYSNVDDVVSEATAFIVGCYGKDGLSMTSARYAVWVKKMSNKRLTSAPDLKTLPPTTETFALHVKRAHYQTILWMSALDKDPPNLDPTNYGWSRDICPNMLLPTPVPENIKTVPDGILQLINCMCSSSHPCSRRNCTCASASMACSIFCKCEGGSKCQNSQTKAVKSTAENADETNAEEEEEDTDEETDG